MSAPSVPSRAKATVHEPFAHTWTATVLDAAPLIAPARQFLYPQQVAGEEDALNRGAMFLRIKPAIGDELLATCALGFREPSLPSGVWSCPGPDDLLAVAGGYAYLIDTAHPETCMHLPMRPVTRILAVDFGAAGPSAAGLGAASLSAAGPSAVGLTAVGLGAASEKGLLLLAGFHHIAAVGASGLLWQSERLSWEGVTMGEVLGGALHGTGWNMQTDQDVPFVMDLRTGRFTGGAYSR